MLLQSVHGPQISRSFQNSQDGFTTPRNTRSHSHTNGSTNKKWGDIPVFPQGIYYTCLFSEFRLDSLMKGIKANRRKSVIDRSGGWWDKDGKYHIPIQATTDNKRTQDVIDIDSQEGPPSKAI